MPNATSSTILQTLILRGKNESLGHVQKTSHYANLKTLVFGIDSHNAATSSCLPHSEEKMEVDSSTKPLLSTGTHMSRELSGASPN